MVGAVGPKSNPRTQSGGKTKRKSAKQMAQENRDQFSPNENIKLVAEVGGFCPKCGRLLVRRAKQKEVKDYELAHIYPCNATWIDELELADEEKLSEDVNDLKNIIALCVKCHHEYDNPCEKEKYREMVRLKKGFLKKFEVKEIYDKCNLNEEVANLIRLLASVEDDVGMQELSFDVKRVDEKTRPELDYLMRKRILNNVEVFYPFIKNEILEVSRSLPNAGELIASQVKTCYLNLAMNNLSKKEIYSGIVSWIYEKTNMISFDAADVLASFFVQNCEVFS